MSLVNIPQDSDEVKEQVTLESIAHRLDSLGAQMDWLCENLSSLFAFVNQMSASGGGIRSIMSMLKQGPPAMTTMEEQGA